MRTLAKKPQSARERTSAKSREPGHRNSILQLQRVLGNQTLRLSGLAYREPTETTRDAATSTEFDSNPGRRKAHTGEPLSLGSRLKISSPGDLDEKQADITAENVLRMSGPSRRFGGATARRQRPLYAWGHPLGQREGKGTKDEEAIEGHAGSGVQSLCGHGSPLPESQRRFYEPRFRHDFSDVRIHTGSRAAGLARSVHARAFTLGRDIVFGSGEYAPQTSQGRHVLAHELAHVVQQRRSAPHIQRLTITQHALTKDTCDKRNVQWVFSLDKAASEDGYIVQQVDRFEYIATCPDQAVGPPAPFEKFWEAWFIKKGDKVDWTTVRDKWTDGSSHPGRPDTNGSYIATGVVKFYKKSTTGDLGDFGKAPADPKSPWGPGKVPTSGALPSTPTEPSWWSTSPVEGPAKRGVWSWWTCCGADKSKHTFDLKVEP